ncbi:MAG: DUF5320 domain-containing protein [Candidatus Aenigmarchaeota archaeon]|nr:DUF5320 domain-containing protein [Candidatus Aenigmarchaeota archaeon]
MPGGDGTGPMGMGPRTGRGLGYCSGYNSPGYTKGFPMGAGFGRGFRGRRWFGFGRFWPRITSVINPFSRLSRDDEVKILEDEKRALEEEIRAIKEELENINKRIEELKKE